MGPWRVGNGERHRERRCGRRQDGVEQREGMGETKKREYCEERRWGRRRGEAR